MDRRRFLLLAGAAAAGLTVAPAFAASASDDDIYARWGPSDVAADLAVAALLGKPLLVLVRPEEPGDDAAALERWTRREEAFGAWLHGGGRDTWARLALAHVTTGSLAEIRAAVPEFVRADAGAPWLVLIETGALAPRVATRGVTLPERRPAPVEEPMSPGRSGNRRDVELYRAWVDEFVTRENAQLDACLAALLGDRLAERAAEVLAIGDVRDALTTVLDAPPDAPDLRVLDAAPVALHRARRTPGAHEDAWVDAVAAASQMRLERQPIRGARLVSNRCLGCGMGRTPRVSRWFLRFLTDDGR